MNAAAPGSPCWLELVTPDRDESVAFYGGLFGWTATEPVAEMGGYSQFLSGGRPIAGCVPVVPDTSADMSPGWSVSLATPDAEEAAEVATARGGSVVLPPLPIPGLGTKVVVADASGMDHVGWQAAGFAGTETAGQPGDPVWFEAHTQDFATTRDFLRDVYGWDPAMASDTDQFRYATNAPEERATAGLMDASIFGNDVGPRWSFYVKVADMEATLARVTDLGGQVTHGPDDSPYGVLATVTDPNGLSLNVIVPPEW